MAAAEQATSPATVQVSSVSGTPGETEVIVSVDVSDLTGVAGGDLVLTYDSTVLIATSIEATEAISGLMMVPNLNVWLANETPAALRGRVLGGFTTALFLGQFLSAVVSQPVSAAVGLAGLYLSAGALLLLMVPLSLVTRRQLRLATG